MKFSKKTFKNGLRVVTIPMKDNPTVTVLVLVAAGSKYESKKVNGISHFLEHMCFKGTENRPKAIDISRELDALGSQSNAFTSQEYTGYYAKSDAKHFNQILDIISDIYLNSTLPKKEVEKEKGVIVEEINMYEDMPQRRVQELAMELLYGDQPVGRSIAGKKKNIYAMKRAQFLRYKKSHYVPDATVVVIAGNVDPKKVFPEVRKKFSSLIKGRKSRKIKVKESQKKPRVLIKYKNTDQAHFVLAFRTFDLKNSRNPALAVLASILAGGMSSRLFQRFREEMGVGYYVRSYNDTYTDHGFLQVSAGVDNRRIYEVLKAALEELQNLKDFEVNKEELEKTKEYIIGNLKLSLESSDDIANFYGLEELLKGRILSLDAKIAKVRKVGPKDIKKVANEVFQNKGLNLALIGPFKEKKQFLQLLAFD